MTLQRVTQTTAHSPNRSCRAQPRLWPKRRNHSLRRRILCQRRLCTISFRTNQRRPSSSSLCIRRSTGSRTLRRPRPNPRRGPSNRPRRHQRLVRPLHRHCWHGHIRPHPIPRAVPKTREDRGSEGRAHYLICTPLHANFSSFFFFSRVERALSVNKKATRKWQRRVLSLRIPLPFLHYIFVHNST